MHALAESLEDETKQAICEPDRDLFVEQRAEWERIVIAYIGWKIENRIVEEDDPLIDFYFKLMKFTNLLSEESDELAAIIERVTPHPASGHLLPASGEKGNEWPLSPLGGERVAEGRVRGDLKLKIFRKYPSRFLAKIF